MISKAYVRIAAIFRETLEDAYAANATPEDIQRLVDLALASADIFAVSNLRFDRDRFLKACGL